MNDLVEARVFAAKEPSVAKGGAGRFLDLDFDKLRGGYYTRPELAAWMCEWAIRTVDDVILEPSCGDGSFLEAAAVRISSLNVPSSEIGKRLFGVEIVPSEAETARAKLRSHLGSEADSTVEEGDFFAWWLRPERPQVDAVVGNPPFIRYQTFPEPHRSRAMAIMADLGMKPNRLTNIWVPFVAAAAACLKPGGRMALVLPAELLQVSYASQLRSFLADRFAQINVVACNELFFDNAEQEVVLLLADGAVSDPSPLHHCRVSLAETVTVQDIVGRPPAEVLRSAEPKTVRHDSEKWLKYFLSAREIGLMRELRESEAVSPLSAHASVDVGVVTGKNEFFVLNSEQVREYGLDGHTVPVVSRSAQMRGAIITDSEWKELAAASNNRVHLLHLAPINGSKPKKALADYIQKGEEAGFHTGYKCSIRKPWYAVPSVWIPDGLFFRQIYDFPRVVLNRASATATDTIHRLRSLSAPAEMLIPNLYTHLTGASSEIEGRSYGGGVLELEPTEAERLLVPAILQKALPLDEIDRLVRAGKLDYALEENDRLILIEGLGLNKAECAMLRAIWEKMRDRRMARKRGRKASGGRA